MWVNRWLHSENLFLFVHVGFRNTFWSFAGLLAQWFVGGNSFGFRREGGAQWIGLERLQSGDYALGIQFSSGAAGVRMLVTEQPFYFFRSKRVVAPPDNLLEIDKRRAPARGNIIRP